MQVIQLEGRVIYRASKGKKVKFKKDNNLYEEIVLKELTDEIEEVFANGNL